MTLELGALLAELESLGKTSDAVLVRGMDAKRVLEIGTSNGYSTLWLATAARAVGGAVTTIEKADDKVGLARANFARSGLEGSITTASSWR